MWQRLGLGIRKLRGKATLQLKFSLSYILVIAAVLYKPLKKYILGQDLGN